jgi:hypothetical protein
MRLLGYDTGGIMQELKSYAFTQRTAAYRMLRKKRICEQLRHSLTNARKPTDGGIPTMPSRDRLPSLSREDSLDPLGFKRSESVGGTSSEFPKLGPKIRKRVGARPPAMPVSTAALK